MASYTLLNKTTTAHYLSIPQPDDKIQVMYVWIDGTGQTLRCKDKTLDFVPKKAEGMMSRTLFCQSVEFELIWCPSCDFFFIVMLFASVQQNTIMTVAMHGQK
jgi:hypothetical protein